MKKSIIKTIIPQNVKNFIKKYYLKFYANRAHKTYPFDNIFHTSFVRSATMWMVSLWNDPIIIKKTGLFPYSSAEYFEVLKILDIIKTDRMDCFDYYLAEEKRLPIGLPRYSTGLHFNLSYSSYNKIPKPYKYRTYFIKRDPRDLLVSFYFSNLISHTVRPWILPVRKKLIELSKEDGLIYSIDHLNEIRMFDILLSWQINEKSDDNIKIFKYEDLSNNYRKFMADLLNWLKIELKPSEFDTLCERRSFKSVTKGREKGIEDINSSYRKGVAGDWKNHLNDKIITKLNNVSANIIEKLGYK